MTSLAFIFGILPLVWATGAGSASRNSLGTAVFGGMIVSTVLNLIFVPVIYVLVEALRERVGHRNPARVTAVASPAVIGWVPVKNDGKGTEWTPVYASPEHAGSPSEE
jgi:multisubunit Na+/H+ antiporter MnhE subunit